MTRPLLREKIRMPTEIKSMDVASAHHPSEETLHSYSLGRLDSRLSEAVDDHLSICADCRRRVSEASSDSFLNRVRDAVHEPDPDSDSAPLTRSVTSGTSHAPPAADSLPEGLAEHPDYQIKRELGRGGMGVVYLAHNTLMGRDEVLKVMSQEVVVRPGVLDRFLREIRAVGRLRHPNIVSAYSAIRIGESIVFSMEYVDGLDLSRMVKVKGPLPVAHACHFVYQAALGLQHAYEEGLVHRDIKPGNLMLSRRGDRAVVKVLDFGLARATQEQKVDSGLTREGQALGTPDYIAPEQILDAPSADIRADIYSLGGTLYYLLTGRPPFQGKSLYDIYQAHISRDADPLNLVRPEVPAELAALVAKMMAKDPARRFQTPDEVAQALVPFFKKSSTLLKGEKPRSIPARPQPEPAVADPAPQSPPIPKCTKPAPEPLTATRSGSLLNLRLDESSPSEKARPSAPDRPRWMWPSVGVGMLMLGVLIPMFAGIFRLKTDHGTLVLEDLPSDAQVFVDGQRIKVTWAKAGQPIEISVPAGEHRVEVKKDGFRTLGEEVTLETGDRAPLRVRLEPLEPSEPAEAAFVSLFNGKDLTGWKGSPSAWSVENGAITSRMPEHLQDRFLVWQGGSVTDFEFRVKVRMEDAHPEDVIASTARPDVKHIKVRKNAAHCGIYYRASEVRNEGRSIAGYKCDLISEPSLLGMLYEDVGRGILARHGEKVRLGAGGRETSSLGDPFEVDVGQWNEYTIIANKNRLVHQINGRTVVDCDDDLRESQRRLEGLLVLWVDLGASLIQFKDVRLKTLSPSAPAPKPSSKETDYMLMRAVALKLPYVYILDAGIKRPGDLWVFKPPLPAEIPVQGPPVEPVLRLVRSSYPESDEPLLNEHEPIPKVQEIARLTDVGKGCDLLVLDDLLYCPRSGALEVYSLADPARPQHLGRFGTPETSETLRMAKNGDFLYLFQYFKTMTVYDISHPEAPRFVETQKTRGRLWSECVVGKYLYAGCYEDSADGVIDAIVVYDVSNPSHPKEVGQVESWKRLTISSPVQQAA